ncbi:MAG TPA: UDP-4-amino-4,6-dideoxy-N-acetyl-beta-L-altrosamine transaminase [Burkholderiales bacterium]|nr:UDP-4-amino-4,6-dideoxy-N-acetyl-beta-L-altrosamine transaminase [Burkholderiales bacterium]
MIPYGRQDISEGDIQAVADVLRSDFLTQGPTVPAFEDVVAEFCGVRFAIAANSATSALHLACLALDVGPGDTVWTSPITFVASANCAVYCGAKVDFVDIDPVTANIGIASLARKLALAKKNGALPKVVIPVHLSGKPCDMTAIRSLADQYGFKIIEDASHAIGAGYRGEPVGNCRFSDIVVFSFHPVKIITTAEGGMAVTNSSSLANRMRRLRAHGITRDPSEMSQGSEGPWYYEQIDLGFNYRMTDMQAALGLSQMRRLREFVVKRAAIAARYDKLLEDLPVKRPSRPSEGDSSWHLYVVRLDLENIGQSHRAVFEALRAAGIGVNLHYIPVYRQPYYARMGFVRDEFPEAEKYYSEAISLPLYPALTARQQDVVVDEIKRACAA